MGTVHYPWVTSLTLNQLNRGGIKKLQDKGKQESHLEKAKNS